MAKLRMRQSIGLAMTHEMERDPRVMLWGEDVGRSGGVFKTSEGLFDQFGPERVRDTPISEMGFLGAAVGASMTGLRPVVEIMFMDFLAVALDQLVTQAAKVRYLSRGQFSAPLVVRGSAGMGLGYGAQHSQSIEPWVMSVPGLKVVSPSSPSTAYGLLRAAIRDENPVLVIEPRVLYGIREDFEPDEGAIIPIGEARITHSGSDITVVGLGSSVRTGLRAAELLDSSVEVIDLLTLAPWDSRTVMDSVARTGRLAIIEDGPFTGGWGATIAAEISSSLFGQLKAPVLRVTAPDVPVPHAEALELLVVPSPEYAVDQIARLIETSQMPEPWWRAREVVR